VSNLLAAVLIVRDERETLPDCLASLPTAVVHVHDTGSTDGTPQLARDLGAAVTTGPWDEDFAAARNAAHEKTAADWILAIDADQRYAGDPGALRAALRDATHDVLRVEIDNVHDELPYTHSEARLYRRGTVTWQGRVHEHLVTADGGEPPTTTLARDAITLTHHGYANPRLRHAKALRNAALARRALQEPQNPRDLARTLLDLGRSLVGAGRRQEAVDTFETLRELFPGTAQWLEGTDFLARLLLAAGMDDACLTLVAQLRDAGAGTQYCDWLAAQALAQLGDVPAAARLLAGVTEVVDTAGRRQDGTALAQLRGLVRDLAAAGGTG
jgi:tetratricopeptide (TPR) repeat protein